MALSRIRDIGAVARARRTCSQSSSSVMRRRIDMQGSSFPQNIKSVRRNQTAIHPRPFASEPAVAVRRLELREEHLKSCQNQHKLSFLFPDLSLGGINNRQPF